MGEGIEHGIRDEGAARQFTRRLLDDLRALEIMLERGMVEGDRLRIGAEQEMVLVDKAWRPASRAPELLEKLDSGRFTPELARFNLEFNLDTMLLQGDSLARLENALNTHLDTVRRTAFDMGLEVLLVGILPTIRKGDLTLENMTPLPRYKLINDVLTAMRGREYLLSIRGVDELELTHDNIMLEAVNTSFQVHFQVPPDEFARRYNLAQAVAGPVLAAAVNSPLLGRYRLWQETRVAVFQQSLDTRSAPFERTMVPRVSFGSDWVRESILEIYREDVSRFKSLFTEVDGEAPLEALEDDRIPRLRALRLHMGTVYRWNRPVYGLVNGRPTLRIENRYLPAGPSVIDEVANAAFWFGLMGGLGQDVDDITSALNFEDVRANFASAAMNGLDAQFGWINGSKANARELILEELLPLARSGLIRAALDPRDIDRYLGVIEERVRRGMTGAAWAMQSLASFRSGGTTWEQVTALVSATYERQRTGKPVHEWPLARIEDAGGWEKNYTQVDQVMRTDIRTVSPEDPVDLVANLMEWHRVRHVPVEDEEHKLVGLVTQRQLLPLVGRDLPTRDGKPAPVSDIMVHDPLTVAPGTASVEAITLMRERRISCLPVVREGRLVGMVTEDDFMAVAGTLLAEKLRG